MKKDFLNSALYVFFNAESYYRYSLYNLFFSGLELKKKLSAD